MFQPPQTHQEAIVQQGYLIWGLLTTVLFVIYQIVCELTIGASPGKKVLQLTVIDYQAHKPQPRRTVIRNLFRLVEIQPLYIFLLLIFTRRRQRVGDLMGQTLVVGRIPLPTNPLQSESDDSQPGDVADYDQ